MCLSWCMGQSRGKASPPRRIWRRCVRREDGSLFFSELNNYSSSRRSAPPRPAPSCSSVYIMTRNGSLRLVEALFWTERVFTYPEPWKDSVAYDRFVDRWLTLIDEASLKVIMLSGPGKGLSSDNGTVRRPELGCTTTRTLHASHPVSSMLNASRTRHPAVIRSSLFPPSLRPPSQPVVSSWQHPPDQS